MEWGLENISSHEIAEWLAFARLEPFGDMGQDIRFAGLMALHAEINRDEKQKKESFLPTDFLPDYGMEETQDGDAQETQSEYMLEKVKILNDAFGGIDKTKKGKMEDDV